MTAGISNNLHIYQHPVKMKLAYCIHSLNVSGGMERVITTKANYLADNLKYEVHIITAHQKGRKDCFRLSDRIIRHDLNVNERMFLRKYRRRLDALLNEIHPDITVSVCGNELYALPGCTDGSVKLGEFHFSHEKFQMKYGGSMLGRAYAAFRTRRLERGIRRLDGFVVLTKADRKDWEKVRPDTIQIYNPLTFHGPAVSPLTRKRCVAAGRLEAQKNFQDLIAAWKTVTDKYPDWTLSIYGNGSLRDRLQNLINATGLTGKVILEGRTDDIHRELLDSSCLAMTSRFEGFPMIILEGLVSGLPVVSYDCPKGPAEMVSTGVNGYLVEVGDSAGIARGICSIIADKALRRRFGDESRKRSAAYNLAAIMGQWDSLFRSLVTR